MACDFGQVLLLATKSWSKYPGLSLLSVVIYLR